MLQRRWKFLGFDLFLRRKALEIAGVMMLNRCWMKRKGTLSVAKTHILCSRYFTTLDPPNCNCTSKFY